MPITYTPTKKLNVAQYMCTPEPMKSCHYVVGKQDSK